MVMKILFIINNVSNTLKNANSAIKSVKIHQFICFSCTVNQNRILHSGKCVCQYEFYKKSLNKIFFLAFYLPHLQLSMCNIILKIED